LQKERVPINIVVDHNNSERSSQMTDEAVTVSITIKVEDVCMEIQQKVIVSAVEEGVHSLAQSVGQQIFHGVIEVLDERIAKNKPAGWRNMGTEKRWMVSSLGAIQYKRRVYLDEAGKRTKPVDEQLGLQHYGRMSGRVQEMGASLVSSGTYRLAAKQLSYMIRTPISHSAIQRMAWSVGNRIADGEEAERQRIFEHGGQDEPGKISAPVLYGESDGVWVHLQGEKSRSTEVRVAILSTGRKLVGKDRFRLENKHCLTAVGLDSQSWQEQILREAHLHYDLEQTRLLVCGGDGNQWVRHSFDRMQIQQEFILDRFHLLRAARRAIPARNVAKALVTRLRQEGFESVQPDLKEQIQQSSDLQRKKLEDFYNYVDHNRDGLLDLQYRDLSIPTCLGAIEGNVDKLVVHRMKGRGCSWRLRGLRAMLAICRNADLLRYHAYRYLPLESSRASRRSVQYLEVEYAEAMRCSLPIFKGPHQNRPWVKSLHQEVYGH
jgi:hypothetical protein